MFSLLNYITEAPTAGATSSANIAVGDSRLLFTKRRNTKGHLYRNRKKKLNEATPGSTNTTSFSNDFGTDSPRLPSELGDLSGKKSLGMGSGFINFNLELTDVVTGKKFNLLRVLNTDGQQHHGDSTMTPPVIKSPYNEYTHDGRFVIDTSKKIKGN